VLIVLFLGGIGWQMWKLHLYNNAVREAKEAGFEWMCEDTISLIRQDWRNALKKETWGAHHRELNMREDRDLSRYREMLHHLRPTVLSAHGYKDENLDALKSLPALQRLALSNCTALQNVDALKSLTALQVLYLDGNTALHNADALKSLPALQYLELRGCTALQNVDALKNLTTLQGIGLSGCDKIPAAALRELRAALPNTDIIFPDGTNNPPQ
jgi:hypothetical protein